MITKSVLRQYRYLVKEIEDIEKRIGRLKKRIERIEEEGVVVDKVSGGEGGLQHFRIEGFPVAEFAKNKTWLLRELLRYENNLNKVKSQEQEVKNFIDNIPDALTRMIFRHYYIDGMSQQEIGDIVHMEQCNISKEISKYLDKLE